MRIGILTQALNGNYGGILQNYALQQVLKQMGHNPITIDRHISRTESRFRNIVKKILRNLHRQFDASLLTVVEKRNLCIRQLDFVDHNINRIGPITTQEDFNIVVSDSAFDAFIVGSDQCWRPCYSSNISNYYLDFIENQNIKRIVYAASFGVDKWEYSDLQTAIVKKAAMKLDAVSVREISGVRLCSEYLGVKAEWVLDPTMLLGVKGFNQFIKSNGYSKPFITEYFLEDNSEARKLINTAKQETGINNCINNNTSKSFKRFTPISRYINISIEDWLSNIANAAVVLTDSFHGVVFSILFNIPFVVRLNETRGNTRIESLLKDFGLEKCIYRDGEAFEIPIIDWAKINSHLERRREQSQAFLDKALG